MINNDIYREFGLINELNEEFSFMDLDNQALLTNPNGLGISFDNSLQLLATTFILTDKKISPSNFSGELLFSSYDNYENLVNFIFKSKTLRLIYKIPYKSGKKVFYRNIVFKSLSKTELDTNGYLIENIILNFLSLWYGDNQTSLNLAKVEDEMRWDFRWDARTESYEERIIFFQNNGHVQAPIKISLNGYAIDPKINVYDENNNNIFSLEFDFNLESNQKLMYSSVDNDLYLKIDNGDGTFTNLFNENYIDIRKNNIFRLPLGFSKIVISCSNDITKGQLDIFDYYYGV